MFSLRRKIHRAMGGIAGGGLGGQEDNVEVGEIDGVRSLYLGSDTIQSSMLVKAPYDLQLAYSKGMMLFMLFAPQVRDILLIGLGGGSIPKYLHHYHPQYQTQVVELNPEVLKVARSHFYLPEDDDRLQVLLGDGVAHIHAHSEATDLLMLDMFDGRGVPLNVYSQDFFDACHACVRSQGLLMINLWGSDKNFDIYLQRIEQSFQNRVLMVPTGRPGNIVVMAFKRLPAELRWEALREKAKMLDAEWNLGFMGLLERLRDHNPNTPHRITMT